MPRRPDVPCSKCGELMWRGRKSLPAGKRTCHPCRRLGEFYVDRQAAADRAAKRTTVPCVVCGVAFKQPRAASKCCSDVCRLAFYGDNRLISEQDRKRWREKAATHARGYGSRWQKIRRVVLAEEAHCGFCGEEVDKSLKAPDPLAASVDHIVRKEDGGTDDRDNLRLAHVGCNAAGRARLTPGLRAPRDCVVCGTSFTPNADMQRACSRPCGVMWRELNAA